MTPEQLKASILQYAIQGKLVEQRPEEGTGEELYQQIQAEKRRLIQEKKIKKEKPLAEISENEIPFDIPESWKWCRLSSLTYNWGQKTPDKRFCYIDVGSINNISHTLNVENTVVEAKDASSRAKKIVQKGDVLFATIRPYLKNICIIDRDFPYEPIVSTAFAVMHCPKGLLNKYLYYYLLSPTFMRFANASDKSKGVAYPAIGEKDFFNGIIALPPFSEQKRLVAKIEELLPLVDRYAVSYEKLTQFSAKFPEDMKKSILQYAIQGKLVEQRPEEGTGEELYQQIQAEKQRLIQEKKIKKEKPLSEISEDEIPFDIPESWKWCRMGSLGITQTGNTPSKAHPEYQGKDIPFITPGDILDGDICYENQALSIAGMKVARICEAGSILQVCIGGSISKVAMTKQRVTFNQQINSITPFCCDNRYIYYVMMSFYFSKTMKEKAGGTATPIINRGIWNTLLLPLPPLAEQKRIVAKIEELLPLCELLK